MKDLKYLYAYTIPLCAAISLWLQGFWSFLTPIYAFVLIPLLELLFPLKDDTNIASEERKGKSQLHWTDFLLYFNPFIVYGTLIVTLYTLSSQSHTTSEFIGLAFSCGIVLGANGINVAHELGHRKHRFEQWLGKFLLLPSLYMHFYIEHNFGHHLKAATKEDPATARYNQSLYSFWVTSIFRQYFSAWKIQLDVLQREGRSFFSFKNDMFWYIPIQLLFGFLTLRVYGLFLLQLPLVLFFWKRLIILSIMVYYA